MKKFNESGNIAIYMVIVIYILILVNKNKFFNLILLGVLLYCLLLYKKKCLCAAALDHSKYEKVLEVLNGGVWEWCDKSKKLFISSRYKKVFKTNNDIDALEKLYAFVDESDRGLVKSFFYDAIESKLEDNFIFEFKTINIENKPLIIECSGKGEYRKGIYKLNGIFLDITEKKRKDELLRSSERKYRRALEGSQDMMFYLNLNSCEYNITDRDGVIFNSNDSSEHKLSKDEWIELILPKDRAKYIEDYNKFVRGKQKYFSSEFRVMTQNDEVLWIKEKGKLNKEDNELYIYGSMSNVTDIKEKEMKIYYMSHYDDITGIPNKRYFIEKANEELNKSKIKNKDFAIIFIDLDNFKYINDTFGHDAGDNLLKSFCDSLNNIIGENCMLARFSGDEFIIYASCIDDRNEVIELLNKILNVFYKPIKVAGKELFCTVSIGASFYSTDGVTVQSLLKKADIAMYKAKLGGKNRFYIFNKKVSNEVNRELAIKRCLRSAIYYKEIYFELQPKYWCESGEIEGFECLARWKSNELGVVTPNEFITAAESTGSIVPIGEYLIEDAFKKCKELEKVINFDFKVAVNISQEQITDKGILEYIKSKIEEYDIDTKNIEFEITESVIMKSTESNIEVLRKIKELGISIALDDFGTGYSSLNYLKILPIDKVKIDRSFVADIGINFRSEFIIEKTIELAHMLNIKVVAEGVENKEQLEYLSKRKCDIIQGYYFSKPLKFNNILEEFKQDEATLINA